MLRQPTEVLEHVVDELDQREDLLSLALTCGRLRDLILPEHLPYRRIVVSVYFKPFFDLILTRSDLAKRVRELTLVNTTSNLVIPRGHSFRRQFTESRLLHESEDEDDSDRDMDTGLWRTLDLAAVIETALTHLLRLRRLEFRGHIEQLSFERILAFHYESLEGLALDSKEGSDAITESSSRSYGSPPAHVS